MSGRRTNLALLLLLGLSWLTGTLAFGAGTGWGSAAVTVHAVAGLALVVLSPWKSVVVKRGLKRKRSGWQASVVLAGLSVVVVLTGLLHAAGVRFLGLGITAMQVHVGAALALIPLAVWHAVARPVRPERSDLSRRALLRGGAVTGIAALGLLATEAAWWAAGTRGARRRYTGSHEVGSFEPPRMPVTQWLFDAVPDVDAGSWRLRLPDGRAVGVAELEVGSELVRATLDCTGGWYATQQWAGVRLDRLLSTDAGDDAPGSVLVRSVTGYARRFPLADLDKLWLATRVGGEPLSAGHGSPARLVAPGRRGFWWVKWVEEISLDDAPPWAQPPFPLQ